MRIMGLDYGSKTVGVAISDPLFVTAQSLEIIRRKDTNKLRQTLARIEQLVQEYEVESIVLGLPKLLNNDESERVERTKEFKAMLERRTGKLVIEWDERLTTVQSHRIMTESNVRCEDRYKYVDMIAAQIILQSYLDYRSNQKEK